MNLANDSYVIWMDARNFIERYHRDQGGWLKVSARGRVFRMTAEQVPNHLLPAHAVSAETGARIRPNVTVKVEHHELPEHTP